MGYSHNLLCATAKRSKSKEREGSKKSRLLAHLLAYHSCPEESKGKIMRASLNFLSLSSSRRQWLKAVTEKTRLYVLGGKVPLRLQK